MWPKRIQIEDMANTRSHTILYHMQIAKLHFVQNIVNCLLSTARHNIAYYIILYDSSRLYYIISN